MRAQAVALALVALGVLYAGACMLATWQRTDALLWAIGAILAGAFAVQLLSAAHALWHPPKQPLVRLDVTRTRKR